MPKVSFIISTYQRPNLLMTLLWSLEAQTKEDIEIIVMDEGDNEEIVKSINDDRIQYHKFKRVEVEYGDGRGTLGLLAKDAGVQHAEGEYICFASEDAYYVPKFVEEMTKHREDFVYCDLLFDQFNYDILSSNLNVGGIDVGNFIVKRGNVLKFEDCFDGTGYTMGRADGINAVKMAKLGTTRKVEQCLYVHN